MCRSLDSSEWPVFTSQSVTSRCCSSSFSVAFCAISVCFCAITVCRNAIRIAATVVITRKCGLRRGELIDLTFDHVQRREDHWAIVDLVGKGGHIRTVPMPDWVKHTIDDWLAIAQLAHGKIFRCVCRKGTVWGTEITEKVVWHVVKEYAKRLGISKLAPHDLRRSCARFCHDSGGELEQIQFLLGHVSVQTTEKYLGCKQRLRQAVNDRLGIEPVV